ncbi:single-stranded DNA-binding protein [Pantanalinema rosaneae CENA516]|uniref:single-stranded DNA-binding protein n=1 Tax=Pantanalinema rosaneae TaxID=1620701 RepID=UPI003D6F2AB4
MWLNTVNLAGHAGEDPRVLYFESGEVVCRLPIVLKSLSKNKNVLLEWIDLEFLNELAETAASCISKGRIIYVVGSIKLSDWEDIRGNNKKQPVVFVNQFYLLDSEVSLNANPELLLPNLSNHSNKSFEIDDYDEYYEGFYGRFSPEDEYQSYRENDTSMDYGYLDDIDNIYDQFHSLGDC